MNYCLEKLGIYGYNISTIDSIKSIARLCGWDEKKDEKSRKFLSDLKCLLKDWNDYPYKKITEYIKDREFIFESYNLSKEKLTIFIHSREPEEIERFKQDYNAITVFVERKEAEHHKQSNSSDKNVKKYKYDFIIKNNSSLDDLKTSASTFLNIIKER